MAPEVIEAEMADDYPKVNKRRRLIRALEKGGKVYLPSAVHSASVINNMTECNCMIDLEAGRKLKAGDAVKIRRIRGL